MRILAGLGLLSASLIGYQVILMQILSYTQWGHFAYMILAVAMLGFGVAGTVLSLFRTTLLKQYQQTLFWMSSIGAVTQVLSIALGQWEPFRFDSYLIFADPGHWPFLALNYLLFLLPFTSGALAIGLVIDHESKRIGEVYASNLLGSGLGAFLVPFLANEIGLELLPRITAFWALLGSLFFLADGKSRRIRSGLSVLAFLVLIGTVPLVLHPSQFKSIAKTLNLPDARIDFEFPSSQGVIQAVSSKYLKYAPAVSLNFPLSISASSYVFENGNLVGPLFRYDSVQALDHSLFHLPWLFGNRKKVLLLEPGTAPLLDHAFRHGARQAHLVIPNPKLAYLLKRIPGTLDNAFNRKEVQMFPIQTRVFCRISTQPFDLILLPTISQLGGDAGINSLTPNFILTNEGLDAIGRLLDDKGIISINSWIDYPPKYPLRLSNSILQFLTRKGINEPERHLIAIRNWGAVAFVVSLHPFSLSDVHRVKAFCQVNGFDPMILAGQSLEGIEVQNELQDNLLSEGMAQILHHPIEDWMESYPFDLNPTSDDRPFFDHFSGLDQISLGSLFGRTTGETGLALVWFSLIQVSFLTLALIIIPLLGGRRQWQKKGWTFFYFAGIGIGFMAIEMVLIHQISFLIGNPIMASGITIGGLLVWSGVGSYASTRLLRSQYSWFWATLAILIIVGVYGLVLPEVLPHWMGETDALKMVVLSLVMGPVGFVLGLPFARGIAFLSGSDAAAIPWAWGINSCFSVLAPIASMIVALQFGYQSLYLAGGLGYVLSFVAVATLRFNSNPF